MTDCIEPYVIISCLFCIDAASTEHNDRVDCLPNMVTLIKPGGLLVLGSTLNSSEYSIGTQSYRAATITERMLENALQQHGLVKTNPGMERFIEHQADRSYAGGLYLTAGKLERRLLRPARHNIWVYCHN